VTGGAAVCRPQAARNSAAKPTTLATHAALM
jgi:hypothetical protein